MTMHYDLTDLQLFVAVAQVSNLTKAAQLQHMSLAAASVRIKSLEAAAGVPLLYREARGVRLTPPGDAFLHHARAILRQTEQMRTEMHDYVRGLRGHVRVHANTTAFTDILPNVLRSFLKANPQVSVELQERQNDDIVVGVLDGRADLGIVSTRMDAPGLRAVHFCSDRLVLVVPRAHPLAKRESVAFAETLDEDHVAMHPASTLREFLSRITAGTGRPMRIRVELSNFDAVCQMVDAGVGIGIVPETSARRNLAVLDLAQVELADAWRWRDRYVLVRKDERLPAYAQALIDALTSSYAGSTQTGAVMAQ